MGRKIAFCSLILILLAIAAGGVLYYQHFYLGSWEYYYSESGGIVANPYQGDYIQIYTKNPEKMYDIRREYPDCHVIMLSYNLDDEIGDFVIPESKLEDLKRSLMTAKELGFSCIFRAAYDFAGQPEDPEFSIILSHIDQIAERLNPYKSCIAGVQAGMIGAFGEWTQSAYMEKKDYRMQVLARWLDALDSEIPVAVRRQKFIREAMDWGLDTRRIGVYNDGLFSSDSDLGTYREEYDRQADLEWSGEHIKVSFNGGEMPYVSEFSTIENVVKEAGLLQLSYLNRDYNADVWKLWSEQEYEGLAGDVYIKKHLGIRPWVSQVSISKRFYRRKTINVEIRLNNSGFAAIDEGYHSYLILNYNGQMVRCEADISMFSKTNGMITGEISNPFFNEKPEEVSFGVQLCRGDAAETEPGYSFQLANQGIRYEQDCNWLIRYAE